MRVRTGSWHGEVKTGVGIKFCSRDLLSGVEVRESSKPPPASEPVMAKRTSAKASFEAFKLKAANAAYYKALSARDMRAMEKVWTCGSDNILIAPPTNPVTHVGWKAIKRNWEDYWPTFSRFSVSMTVTALSINGPVGWVHGIENIH
jgi:ketosteroid isomerase-like protein